MRGAKGFFFNVYIIFLKLILDKLGLTLLLNLNDLTISRDTPKNKTVWNL